MEPVEGFVRPPPQKKLLTVILLTVSRLHLDGVVHLEEEIGTSMLALPLWAAAVELQFGRAGASR